MSQIDINARSETTALKQPKELFSYSRNIDGTWNLDEAQSKTELLSYYYFPDALLASKPNLSQGLKNFIKIPDAMNVADFPSLLKGLQNHEQIDGKRTKVDIITFRGIMTKMLTLPYNLNNGIDLYITAFDKQLFIKNNDELDEKRKARPNNDPQKAHHMQVCEFAGYKFECLTTIPKPWAQCTRQTIDKRDKKVVNNYEQYISVVKTGIGKVKTLLAGEVDCLWDYIPEDGESILPHYVELKTSRVVTSPNQAIQFEKKLFRTWAQCFLLGIKRIVYGFRDDEYALQSVEIFDTEEVPLLLKDNEIPRNENPRVVCIDALKWYGAVLDWLTKNIDLSDELVSYKFSYLPNGRYFRLSKCTDEENSSLREGGILTEEFKQWRRSIRKD